MLTRSKDRMHESWRL